MLLCSVTFGVEWNMETALERLRALWAEKNYHKALKLAASWPRLGGHARQIRQGWAAISNPDFYRQLGRDPEALYSDGLAAVAEQFGLQTVEKKESGKRT